jgi:hypothetical protein
MHPGTLLDMVGYGVDGMGNEQVKKRIETELIEVGPQGGEFEYRADGGGACDGDSGAPVFAYLDGGEVRLVGLHHGSEECGGVGTGTTLYPSLCWLRDEAGVDLLPDGDADCTAVDLAGAGCAVGANHERGPGASLVLGLLLVFTRPGRRPGTGSASRTRASVQRSAAALR